MRRTNLEHLYQRLNREQFDGRLPDMPVVRGMPDDAAPEQNGICRWRRYHSDDRYECIGIFLDEWLWTVPEAFGRSEMIENTLLHEMVHLVAGPLDDHGPLFVAECNRIAE